MKRLHEQRGQTVVMLVFFLLVIVLVVGAVLDLGAWFRSDRATLGLGKNSDRQTRAPSA